MAKIKITAIKDTENLFKMQVSVDNVLQNHTSILGAELRASTGKVLADSDIDPTDWDFTHTDYLTVKLGLADIPAGEYTCRLILKDASHPIGIAWDTDIILTVLP